MQPNVIPLIPQGHFFQQLYHKTAWGMSSLKTSSFSQLLLVVAMHMVATAHAYYNVQEVISDCLVGGTTDAQS